MTQSHILLADDHSLILEGVRRLIENHYQVVGSADNGKSLVEAAFRLKPDLVILDIGMPILNGIDAAREIKKGLPALKFLFLSMQTNPIYLRKALDAGASGYVLKSGASEELLKAIAIVMRGGSYVSPGFGQEVIESILHWPEKSNRVVIELTDRQREILQLIAEVKQNKEIADIVHVSVKTVEFHRGRLMAKLGAHTVAQLTRLAIEEGLICLAE